MILKLLCMSVCLDYKWTISSTIDRRHIKDKSLKDNDQIIIAIILLRTKQHSKENSRIIFVPLEYKIIKASTVLIHSFMFQQMMYDIYLPCLCIVVSILFVMIKK
jgi:hypothetical protein